MNLRSRTDTRENIMPHRKYKNKFCERQHRNRCYRVSGCSQPFHFFCVSSHFCLFPKLNAHRIGVNGQLFCHIFCSFHFSIRCFFRHNQFFDVPYNSYRFEFIIYALRMGVFHFVPAALAKWIRSSIDGTETKPTRNTMRIGIVKVKYCIEEAGDPTVQCTQMNTLRTTKTIMSLVSFSSEVWRLKEMTDHAINKYSF